MFARHFAAQSFDAAGKVGVQLQKIILFLVFASVLSLVDLRLSTIIGVSVMVLIYAVGGHGAAGRRRCALACYSVLMSVYVALTVALLVFLLVMVVYARVAAPADDAETSDAAMGMMGADMPMSMAASMMPALPPAVHAMLGRPEATTAPTIAPDAATESEEGEEEQQEDIAGFRGPVSPWYYVVASLYFFVCMVTFALKVYTIKLACEMHRHLLAAERAGNVDGARSSCCRSRALQKLEPVESTKAAPGEAVYVPACYPPGVNDDATPGASAYPPNCYQPLNEASEH